MSTPLRRTRVLTLRQIALLAAVSLALGAALTGAGIALALGSEPVTEFAQPQIIKESEDVAVARFPARRGEVTASCVLFVDYRARSWALTC